MPANLTKFISKEATSEAATLKPSWQLRCVYVTSSVLLEIGGREKDLRLTWHSLQGQQNIFSPSDYQLPYTLSYHF